MNVSILRLAALLSSAATIAACAKGDQANQASTDSTAAVATTPATPMSGSDKPLPANAQPASKPAATVPGQTPGSVELYGLRGRLPRRRRQRHGDHEDRQDR